MLTLCRQEEEAAQVEEVAYDARNASADAVALARKALDDQTNMANVIKVSLRHS